LRFRPDHYGEAVRRFSSAQTPTETKFPQEPIYRGFIAFFTEKSYKTLQAQQTARALTRQRPPRGPYFNSSSKQTATLPQFPSAMSL
jgi:hypothetical protein